MYAALKPAMISVTRAPTDQKNILRSPSRSPDTRRAFLMHQMAPPNEPIEMSEKSIETTRSNVPITVTFMNKSGINVPKNGLLSRGALMPAVLCALMLASCVREQQDPRAPDIQKRIDRLMQVPMEFDATSLPGQQKELLRYLVEASKLAHEVYLHQTYPLGVRLRDSLALRGDEFSRQVLRLVIRNGGPFDRMDRLVNFVDQAQLPPGRAFYPHDVTNEEIDDYVALFPGRGFGMKSPYTIIRRDGGDLVAMPYYRAYEEWLVPAAELLRKGAAIADHEGFASYLAARAEALINGNYDTSHVLWLELRGNDIDLRLAPDRVTDDKLFNIRASFSSSVMVKNATETAKLNVYSKYIDELERNLPIESRFKRSEPVNPPLIQVVQDVIRGGTLAVGYQRAVTSFGRDPLESPQIGGRNFISKNILDARVEHVLLPMARELFASDHVQHITPDGVLLCTALREFSFALGPQYVADADTVIAVSSALSDLHPLIETAKATIAGLHSGKYLMEAGVLPQAMEKTMYVSSLASLLQAMRVASTETEQRAGALIVNALLDKGAIRIDPNSDKLSVLFSRMPSAVAELTGELLMLQATGNYVAAEEFLAKWSSVGREMSDRLGGLLHVPEDIEPVYSFRW